MHHFEGCLVSLLECLFTGLGIHYPFSDFMVAVMDHLKVSPSQLHPRAWNFIKVFQLRVE